MRAWRPIIVYLLGALALAWFYGGLNPFNMFGSQLIVYGVIALGTFFIMSLALILGRGWLAWCTAIVSWTCIALVAPTVQANQPIVQEQTLAGASPLDLQYEVDRASRRIYMTLTNHSARTVSSAKVTCQGRYGNGRATEKNIVLGVDTLLSGDTVKRRVAINNEYLQPGVDLAATTCTVSSTKVFAQQAEPAYEFHLTQDNHYVFEVTNTQQVPLNRIFFACTTSDGLLVRPGLRPLYSASAVYNIAPGTTFQLVTMDTYIVRTLSRCDIVSAVWES